MPARSDNINMLNAVRGIQSLEYQDRIPVATQENLNDIYQNILNIEPVRNAFVSSLVNRIALTSINEKIFENPLRGLKSSSMPYGTTEQEIFVNMAKGTGFNPFAGYEEAFAFYEANVMAAYHKVNFQQQYPVTITFENLRNAFTDAYGIRSLIRGKVDSLYSGANWDEYLVTKNLLINAYKQGLLYAVHTDEVQDELTAKSALVNFKTFIGMMQFPSTKFNLAGATSFSSPSDLLFFTTPATNAQIDVDALAYAFHLDRAQVEVQTIILDDFGDTNIIGAIVDRRWFKIRDQFRTFTEQHNAFSLNWNFVFTVSEMFSMSPFMPAVVFTGDQVAATTLDVSKNQTTYTKGETIELQCVVTAGSGTSYVPQGVSWEVKGNTDRATGVVPGTHTLLIGPNETGNLTLTVKSLYVPVLTATVSIVPA